MAELLEYKCPCCGGAIEFNPKLQKIECPYCTSEFDPEALKSLDETSAAEEKDDMQWDTASGEQWREEDGMAVYICKSCGGEIIGDEHMAATNCPYCGNPVVMLGKLSGELRPDYVIPFELDKNAAKEGLRKHLSDKKLLPKVFKDENHLDEIKGVYVPFWLFDADADASIRYKGTKVRHWSDSRYHYTETSYFSLFRSGRMAFEKIPADGSSKFPDDLMESIEPYDYSEAVDFTTAYLAGYLADKYDLAADQHLDRVNARAKKSVERTFASTVNGYLSTVAENSSVRLTNGKAKYALLPVWLLNTTWRGEKYTFAMNGQTGKFVGNLPMDNRAYWRYFGISAAICTALAAVALLLFHLL